MGMVKHATKPTTRPRSRAPPTACSASSRCSNTSLMPSPGFVAKIATPPPLRTHLGLPRPLVFTNGVFDILHRGHVTYLDHARGLGAPSWSASTPTRRRVASPRGGPTGQSAGRPTRRGRGARIRGPGGARSTKTLPLALVVACHPDIIVKGGDYTVETTVGAAEVIGWGGRFEAIPLLPGRSTTRLSAKSVAAAGAGALI